MPMYRDNAGLTIDLFGVFARTGMIAVLRHLGVGHLGIRQRWVAASSDPSRRR